MGASLVVGPPAAVLAFVALREVDVGKRRPVDVQVRVCAWRQEASGGFDSKVHGNGGGGGRWSRGRYREHAQAGERSSPRSGRWADGDPVTEGGSHQQCDDDGNE